MRHLALLGSVPLLFAISLPAQAQMITITPEQIGQIFCIGSIANDMAPVEALLTPDLKATIVDAQARSDAIHAATPDEKPPLGDGIPWRSQPEYADGCVVSEISADGAVVTISYTFSGYPDGSYSNDLWLERVVMQEGYDPVWRISEIDLGDGYTLRSVLVSVFQN